MLAGTCLCIWGLDPVNSPVHPWIPSQRWRCPCSFKHKEVQCKGPSWVQCQPSSQPLVNARERKIILHKEPRPGWALMAGSTQRARLRTWRCWDESPRSILAQIPSTGLEGTTGKGLAQGFGIRRQSLASLQLCWHAVDQLLLPAAVCWASCG